jgi:hypothetical protein
MPCAREPRSPHHGRPTSHLSVAESVTTHPLRAADITMSHPQLFTERQPVCDSVPKESLVLALTEGWSSVDARIAAVWPECRRQGVELVVVSAVTTAQLAAARSRYPGARFIAAAAGTAPAQLRRLGLDAATGHIVTMVDSRTANLGRLGGTELELRLESVS